MAKHTNSTNIFVCTVIYYKATGKGIMKQENVQNDLAYPIPTIDV